MMLRLVTIFTMTICLATVAIFAVPGPAIAQDEAALNAPCDPPELPASFKTQAEFNSFKEKADAYKACIDTFVAEQEKLMTRHQQAANRAIESWNGFAAEVNKLSQPKESGQ